MPDGDGLQNLQPLGITGEAAHFFLAPAGAMGGHGAPTSVALFNQGLLQVLQASVTGLIPMHSYVIGLTDHPDGTGALEPLMEFKTNPAGSAIVNTVGPIRQIVQGNVPAERRYLAIAEGTSDRPGALVQRQLE